MARAEKLHEFPVLGPEDVFDNRYAKMPSGCWEWSGTRNSYGYGILLLPGERPVRAHRYSYERSNGKIPKGKVVMHDCDNPPCVNPSHLTLGTRLENNRQAWDKGRRPRGELHFNAKIKDSDIDVIRKSADSQAVLAAKYRVSQTTISRIRNRKRRYAGSSI